MNRLHLIPDERLAALMPLLKANLALVVDGLRADNLVDLVGQIELGVLTRAAEFTRAHELLLWGRYDRGYDAVWTSLPPVEEVIGAVSAEPARGLVSEVVRSEHTTLQLADALEAAAWTNLERRRGRRVDSMVASPVPVAGKCVAVLTLVRYASDEAATSLEPGDAGTLDARASLLGRLIEDRLIRLLLGFETT